MKKWRPGFLAALWLSVSGVSPAEATGDLIENGGFEEPAREPFLARLSKRDRAFYPGLSDSPASGWAFGGRWEGGKYEVRLSREAHRGKHSVEIHCLKKGRGGIASRPFTLTPGTILKVSFWLKARGAAGGVVRLNFEGTPGDGWEGMDIPGGDYGWKKITKRCVVPVRHSGPEGQRLVIFIYSKTMGSIWIDDVEAETVDVNELAESPSAPALAPPRPEPIPEPSGGPGYRIDTASSLVKIFPDTDYKPASELGKKISISLARNEVEDAQLIVEAPWRDVRVEEIRFSDLKSEAGASLPSECLSWRRVDFVETTFTPPYPVERVGLYPDPLMPPGPFTVKKLSRTPVWISVRTRKDAQPGVYRGVVTVLTRGLSPMEVPIEVTVWDFAVPDRTHLRTLTWFNGFGWFPHHYGFDRRTEEGRRLHEEATRRFWDMLLRHRLGPGGNVASHVWKRHGRYDFSDVDRRLEYLIPRGMNAFIMGSAPNLKRQGKNEYTPEFIARFTEMLKAYGDHLREKGWIDKAYVYTYDEAPRRHWGEVRNIARAIKRAAPELKIIQCLNQPAGVKALSDVIDVFDIYVAQYHKTGVRELQKRGTEVWLAVCCYPMDHPNLFIEYPLIDARMLPLFCWKYKAQGFEYWSPASWGRNVRRGGTGPMWPEVPWDPNTFGRYNGDGYLLYPGPGGVPYPSVRLKALRDGFEDYEYLWLLRALLKEAKNRGLEGGEAAEAERLLSLEGMIAENGTFENSPVRYCDFRSRVAEAIMALRKRAGEKKR